MPSDAAEPHAPGEWVLLSYRMPRAPSTPRIAVWPKLKRLRVAQLADGVVALPADARTREHLEWLADEILDAGGIAGIWIARPATAGQERELASSPPCHHGMFCGAANLEALRPQAIGRSGRQRTE